MFFVAHSHRIIHKVCIADSYEKDIYLRVDEQLLLFGG